MVVGTATRKVQALTTAASIWAATGIGVAAALGIEATAVLSTIIVLIVLIVLAVVPRVVKPSAEVSVDSDDEPLCPGETVNR